MKKKHLLLVAAVLIMGTSAISQATAAVLSGDLNRAANFSPPRSTECRTVGPSGSQVQFDSNLNFLGGNLNIAPFDGCRLVQRNHTAALFTECFAAGWTFSNTYGGGAGSPDAADIFHDCFPHGDGKRAVWQVTTF